MRIVFLSLSVFVIAGCSNTTNKGVYEGIQMGNKNQCYELPKSEKEACLERNNLPYEEYEQNRSQ